MAKGPRCARPGRHARPGRMRRGGRTYGQRSRTAARVRGLVRRTSEGGAQAGARRRRKVTEGDDPMPHRDREGRHGRPYDAGTLRAAMTQWGRGRDRGRTVTGRPAGRRPVPAQGPGGGRDAEGRSGRAGSRRKAPGTAHKIRDIEDAARGRENGRPDTPRPCGSLRAVAAGTRKGTGRRPQDGAQEHHGGPASSPAAVSAPSSDRATFSRRT